MKQDRPRGDALSLLFFSACRRLAGMFGRLTWSAYRGTRFITGCCQGGLMRASTVRESKLQVGMDLEIDTLMARQRITLLKDGLLLVCPDDAAAIVSGVLAVRVDARTDDCSRRRRRLHFDGAGGTATVLARTRPVPDQLKGRPCVIRTARLRSGRRITVSCLDVETCTLHVLLDLAGALPVTAEPADGAARLIIGSIYGAPIRDLLSRGQPLRIGDQVAQTTLHLLGSLSKSRHETLEKELRFLKTLLQNDKIPQALQVRVDRIQHWLAENPEEPQMDLPVSPATDGEGSRLAHLVASRACGYIHISPGEITGLANPRMVDGHGIHPYLFRLRLPGQGEQMFLDLWDARIPEPRRARACLGQAATVFLRFQKMQDIYGTVDFVLGFLETNGIGAFSVNGGSVPRRRQFLVDDFFCRGTLE